MFTLYDSTVAASICLSSDEPLCVQLAVQDLLSDLEKVGQVQPALCPAPEAAGPRLLIGTLGLPETEALVQPLGLDTSPIAGKWEHYLTEVLDDETMVILGSNERGTMWGIYDLCAKHLGVDPLYWWTGHEPQHLAQVTLPRSRHWDGPTGQRFRGWFINDEDLLESQQQHAPAPGERPLLERIVEAALRLKQNLLIPCSFLDINDPREEDIVRLVTSRGLFISMHHQEPVGVRQQTIDAYAAAHGLPLPNYVDHPAVYEQLWLTSIRRWARYPNVIWQLGLRGRGDRPVWYGCQQIPDTDEARGALISNAIHRQLELIHQVCGTSPIYSTTTLWMEGMPLYEAGVLDIPQETIIVMSDFGPDQSFPASYEQLPRLAGHAYGVYYHLAFWGCGPHLVQGNPPDKIHCNWMRARQVGDTDYLIVNVANVREFVCGIDYLARLSWNPTQHDPAAFLTDWCRREFRGASPQAVSALYQQYFDAFAVMDETDVPHRMLLMDGMCRRVGLQLLRILQGQELDHPDIQNQRLFDFPNTDRFIDWYLQATQQGAQRFAAASSQAEALCQTTVPERQQFFRDHLLMPIALMRHLYAWLNALCRAARQLRINGCIPQDVLAEASAALEQAQQARQQAAHGPWAHWYDLDTLSEFAALLQQTAALQPPCP